jgi:hypothetical protein
MGKLGVKKANSDSYHSDGSDKIVISRKSSSDSKSLSPPPELNNFGFSAKTKIITKISPEIQNLLVSPKDPDFVPPVSKPSPRSGAKKSSEKPILKRNLSD